MNILNVGYDSTNYYILADSKPRLLIDIKHLLATHYHPDHAGVAQELKRTGIK